MACNGNCAGCMSSCGAAAGELTMTEAELRFLAVLGQHAFLPVERKPAEETPVYPDSLPEKAQEDSLVLQCLEKKGLITLDYDIPLKGYTGYGSRRLQGSMALTLRGQQVLELMEFQGADPA